MMKTLPKVISMWVNLRKNKNLPFCRIVAYTNMKRATPKYISYWTEYDRLYNKRDGWLVTPFLSPTFV